ncbi:hypothetical protein SAMN02949497_3509 [Methylomagnum ishizawai]|uniref:Uncharacterized protein n=1 Tax=Methylomagnum ishizawai TaxID=1760988 RepID=A0A1Y6D8L0_9GAMM|nr:hypothetical protein [Methylomagnum ishizawai]SMF96125.1 hypothetical protein SAMN02949497_3509 [Methylomagnum ishizawai]
MTLPIHVFHSGMPNIPQLPANGGAGALNALIHACGVTGFGEKTLDDLSHVDGVATASCSAGLQLADGINGMPHRIEISGSTNGWNGQYELSAPPGSTTCTFNVDPGLPATCTGPVTLKRAPAGMTRLSLVDDQAVYQFRDTNLMPGYLLLDDSQAQYAAARLAESAVDPLEFGTMIGLCPTTLQVGGPGLIWRKTNSSGDDDRPFVLVFWAGGLYLFIAWYSSYPTQHDPFYAGACLTRRAADAFPGIITGSTVNTVLWPGYNHGFHFKSGASQVGQYLQRGYAQVGSAMPFQKTGMAFESMLGGGTYPDPNPVDNANDAWGPIAISEGTTNTGTPVRGFMPGLWDLVNCQNRSHLDILQNMPHLPGRRILLVGCGYGSQAYPVGLDIDGPWGP